jgi:integrase
MKGPDMAKIAFSDATISAIKSTKATFYSDSSKRAVPGLRLMVGPRSKSWYLNKREGRKVRQIRLGEFPDLMVELARRRAREMINAVETGKVEEVRDHERTFTEALEEYIRHKVSLGSLSEKTAEDYRGVIRVHAPDLGSRPLNKITTRDVEGRFLALEGHPSLSNKLVRVMRQTYKHACAHDDDLRDPTRIITQLRYEPRREPLSHDLALVVKDIAAVDNVVRRLCWSALLHTGIRSGNLRSLTWDNIDLDERTVFLAKMKNRESRTLPLSDFAIGLFEEAKKFDATWVFPSFRRPGPLDSLDTLQHCRQHDLRHHFTTSGLLARIPEPALAYLRGDRVKTENEAMARYLHQIGTHEDVNHISEKILERSSIT